MEIAIDPHKFDFIIRPQLPIGRDGFSAAWGFQRGADRGSMAVSADKRSILLATVSYPSRFSPRSSRMRT